MLSMKWPSVWKVRIDEKLEIELPLVEIGNGFYIKVLHATKPEYKLIDRLAITA